MSAVWPELEEIFYKASPNIHISYYQLLYHIYTSAQTADFTFTSVVHNKEEERCRVDLVVGLVGLWRLTGSDLNQPQLVTTSSQL